MKVVFLDIDGVLNNEIFVNAFWAICKQVKLKHDEAKALHHIVIRDDFGNLFCPTATNALAYLIQETDAKIVISSTWRMSGLKFMQDLWKHRNLPGEVIDITPISRRGQTQRGEEIKQWLFLNQVKSYCIIDDDIDMLEEQKNNFIKTSDIYGLSIDNAYDAIKILNENK